MMDSKRNTGTALPFKVKISYSAGEMASQFMWTFTSSYLTIFYTDIAGLSAAAIGLIFMVARVWDAVNDPMMGLIATGVSAVGLPILLYFSGGQNYSQKGYLVLTIAIAAVVVPLFLGVVFRNCREVVKPVNQGKVSVVQSLKTCMNWPLVFHPVSNYSFALHGSCQC